VPAMMCPFLATLRGMPGMLPSSHDGEMNARSGRGARSLPQPHQITDLRVILAVDYTEIPDLLGDGWAAIMAVVTSSPAAQEAEPVAQGAAEARRIRRPRDMALSLAVLLVPIILAILVGRFLYGDSTTATADPSLALSGAARASMSPPPHAAAVPDGWKLVSALYRDGVLRLGYLTAADKGVQLIQGSGDPDALIRAELTGTGRELGQVNIGSATWHRWSGRSDESALVRRDDTTTVIVVGAVDEQDLVKLVTITGA